MGGDEQPPRALPRPLCRPCRPGAAPEGGRDKGLGAFCCPRPQERMGPGLPSTGAKGEPKHVRTAPHRANGGKPKMMRERARGAGEAQRSQAACPRPGCWEPGLNPHPAGPEGRAPGRCPSPRGYSGHPRGEESASYSLCILGCELSGARERPKRPLNAGSFATSKSEVQSLKSPPQNSGFAATARGRGSAHLGRVLGVVFCCLAFSFARAAVAITPQRGA